VLAAQRKVVVERSRVGVEVVAAVELQRVDEDADHHHIGVPARFGHECEVAVVQGTHRRYQRDGAAGYTLSVAPCHERRGLVEHRRR